MTRTRVLIVGAAGRDFHNFNLVYRGREQYEVVAFTATQIPNIDGRAVPGGAGRRPLSGGDPDPAGERARADHRAKRIDEVVFSYSDVTHEHVMHIASRALAAGANFRLLSPDETELRSTKPVVAVCAVRTGSGKSQTTRHVAALLRDAGHKVAVLRHPMPYGDLTKQAVQRFARYEDLDAADCTIEEREEYEPHLGEGNLVFAGVDYARDPGRGRAGGRRHPLGRRQQRHAVHQARPAHRRRRPAPARPRAPLPPGRDEPADGGRLHREQGGQREPGGDRRGARLDPRPTTRTRASSSPLLRSTSRGTRPRSPASACSRSRTGRR